MSEEESADWSSAPPAGAEEAAWAESDEPLSPSSEQATRARGRRALRLRMGRSPDRVKKGCL
jgi:hypothetical protein